LHTRGIQHTKKYDHKQIEKFGHCLTPPLPPPQSILITK
jgi:hypothetical protein